MGRLNLSRARLTCRRSWPPWYRWSCYSVRRSAARSRRRPIASFSPAPKWHPATCCLATSTSDCDWQLTTTSMMTCSRLWWHNIRQWGSKRQTTHFQRIHDAYYGGPVHVRLKHKRSQDRISAADSFCAYSFRYRLHTLTVVLRSTQLSLLPSGER